MRAKVRSLSLGGSTNLALMAPIKAGFVPGFETITYVERLRRLLNAMNASRQNAREGELRLPVLPDTIGRLRVIRSFRYAIWPRREQQLTPERAVNGPLQSYLTLNVGFDGGFEPYMRAIYDDIGPLLDALLCHCPGYPGSRLSSYDEYCRWVRERELAEGTFYSDADAGTDTTAADARHLARLERAQREAGSAADADLAVAALALTPLELELNTALQAVAAELAGFPLTGVKPTSLVLPLRTLKGLYRLAPLFPPSLPGQPWPRDDWVLRGFAQLLLGDLRGVFAALMADPKVPPSLKDALKDEMQWLAGACYERLPPVDRLVFDRGALQDAILNRDDPVTHGCMALLRIEDAALAAHFLASLRAACDKQADPQAVRHQVALTHPGLRALGLPEQALDALAPEFAEGMEARNSILGDVRGNHPNHWRRPRRLGASPEQEDRIDLSVVHVVVLLRLVDKALPRETQHPRLEAAARALANDGTSLVLLALEPLHASPPEGDLPGRDHFGFVDGLSQPQPVQKKPQEYATDEVAMGELLLGYANDRQDAPCPAAAHALLDNGSYLVVRKLRQRLEHLEAALAGRSDADAVQAHMMGRWKDGTPLVPGFKASENHFDFRSDLKGEMCPFQSHVRRANPRDGRRYTPRILRRGLSYGPPRDSGPGQERGIMFMAYCASIAEQFETIQGWIAGGNSSGVSSAQSDPFLGVPRPGEKRTFRYLERDATGAPTVKRVDLGARPFVELQWGLYLFVPSLAALQALPALRQGQCAAAAAAVPLPPLVGLATWRERLEDQDRSPAVWAAVRAQPRQRFHAPGYGTLVAGLDEIRAILADRSAADYSVRGYAGRMQRTIGLNYLGLDPPQGHDRFAKVLNPIIQGIAEPQAHAAAYDAARQVLSSFALSKMPAGVAGDGHGERMPIDLMSYSELALGCLCAHWFGLPDGHLMVLGGRVEGQPDDQEPPRCPAHTYGASRTIFAPHPNPTVEQRGTVQGPKVLRAVRTMLGEIRSGARTPTATAKAIIEGLDQALTSISPAERDEAIAGNLAGMLLGFPPTVHGNLMQVLRTWIEEGTLWEQQQWLAEALGRLSANATPAARFAAASAGLRGSLMATMRRCPIPEMLWRSPVVDGKAVPEADDIDADRRLVLGIRSAMTDPMVPDELMFGGSCDPRSAVSAVHACPGYAMGVGVMLGLLHALLDAGTLRATGSPVLLILTPKV